MRIVTVSGTCSCSGKTTFIEEMLKRLKGWSCLKVTLAHKGAACPIQRNCGACDKLKTDFCIVTDEKIITQEGKDTHRFKKAGAKQVFWLKAHSDKGLKQGLKKVMSMLDKSAGLIIEGTTIFKHLESDLAVLMVRKDLPWKESAKKVFGGFFRKSDMRFKHNAVVLFSKKDIREARRKKDASKIKSLA